MQLVLQVQSGYFFEEMYLPLIKSLPKETEVVVLLDMDKSDRYIEIIKDLCLSLPKVLKVLVSNKVPPSGNRKVGGRFPGFVSKSI
jgi:hypothetical protein